MLYHILLITGDGHLVFRKGPLCNIKLFEIL